MSLAFIFISTTFFVIKRWKNLLQWRAPNGVLPCRMSMIRRQKTRS